MTQYREILRLYNQGINISSIASCCECSRNTVKNVLQNADELGVIYRSQQRIVRSVLNRFALSGCLCA